MVAISASVSPPDTEELHPIIVRLREHSPDDARIVQAWCNDLNRIGNENDDIREFLSEWDDSDTFIADSTLDIVMWAIKDLRAKAQPAAPQQEPVAWQHKIFANAMLYEERITHGPENPFARIECAGRDYTATPLYAAPQAAVPEATPTDQLSRWLMRNANGDEWETSSEYTELEISNVPWKSKPVRRLDMNRREESPK